jgi:hypothetical protein
MRGLTILEMVRDDLHRKSALKIAYLCWANGVWAVDSIVSAHAAQEGGATSKANPEK